MSKKQSFIGGVFLLTIAMFICKFIAFFNNIVLVNIDNFGDKGIAIYTASLEIYMIVLAVSTMGVPSAIAKMVSEKLAVGDRRSAHRIFTTSFFFLMGVGAVAVLLLVLLANIIFFLVKVDAKFSVIALAPTAFFAAIMAVFRGYFQGMQDMRPQAVSQVLEQVFKFVFSIMLVFVFLPYGINMAAAGATFGITAGGLTGTLYLIALYNNRKKRLLKEMAREQQNFKAESGRTIIGNLIRLAIPISLGSIIATISSLVDLTTIMHRLETAGFTNEQALVLYGQLAKVQQLVNFPIALNISIATAIVPAIASARVVKDYDTVRNRVMTALRMTIIIGLPSAVGMSVLSNQLVELLFPKASGGGNILTVLAFTVIFMALAQSLAGILQGLNRIYIPAIGLLAGATVKLILNFSLISIPSINIIGAAFGSIACYFIASLINLMALRKVLRLNFDLMNTLVKPVLATMVMGVVTFFSYAALAYLFGSNAIAILLSIILSAMTFILVLIFLGAIGYSDFKVFPMGERIGNILLKANIIKDWDAE